MAFSQDPTTPNSGAKKNANSKKKGLPLKPERKLEFSTDEGTWTSVDISPDGKTLLFDLLGEIYTMPGEGGEAKLLFGGMAYEAQPKFSPDGKRVVFVSDREGSENVFIADTAGGNLKQLTRETQASFLSPVWTPDGEYVIVSRRTPAGGSHELWMYHVKGGTGVQVTRSRTQPVAPGPPAPGSRATSRRDLGVAVSPDGKYLYYARRTGEFSYNMELPAWQLVRRDRLTGDEDTITSEVGSAFRPVLTPDGKSLLYLTRTQTETELRMRDLASGEERLLKRPVQRDDQESRAMLDVYPGYAVTPDGKEVVISYGGKIHRLNLTTLADTIIPFNAKVALDLGPRLSFAARVDDAPTFRARLIQQPALSPDGKRIAFSAMTRIYAMNMDGGTPARLTQSAEREYQPAWSPDGQWIAYTTWGRNGGHVWKIRADGAGAPTQLTRVPAFYNEPVWTPDGQRLVVLRASRKTRLEAGGFGFGGAMDLTWLPATGGDTTLIVPSRGLGRPHFTKDPQRVYVNSAAGLVSMRFDGTDRRTHLRVTGRGQGTDPVVASDVRMHPDGRLALAMLNNQIYVVTVPPPLGETPNVNVNTPAVPLKKITDLGADSMAWVNGGRTILFHLGSTIFRQELEKVSLDMPAAAEGRRAEGGAEPAAEAPKTPPTFVETDVAIQVARPKPTGSIVLRGARVITMKGDEVLKEADVVITGNRIAGVGKKGSVSVPAGAKIQDVKGATVMPGVIDVHAHWLEIKRGVLDMDGWPYMANLAYGVTTGRDPQTGSNDAFAYQDLIDAGEILGPRAYSTGPGVFAALDFQSLDDAKNVVARYRKYYRTHTLKSYAIGNRRQRQWMVEASNENKMMPTTEGALDLKLDLTHAIDGFSGNEHALPIVPLYKDVVQLYAQSGIFYTPTLLVSYGGPWAENFYYATTEVLGDPKLQRFIAPNVLYQKSARRPWFRKEEHVFPKIAAEAAKIVRAGGRVQIGGHGQLQGIQCHWEMWALASGGMTNHEVLRAATLHGAEAIGFAQDLGSVEAGKLADLVVLNKDPLSDIRNTTAIRYVIKNGVVYTGDKLDEVWPQQKPAPSLWWHEK